MLSSYNGEKYIREQIDSILAQKGVEVQLIVRDDGSTDGTLDILSEYEQKGLLELWVGDNWGFRKSFLYLIDNAPKADFYALSDQDDVWYEDKLIRAVEMLTNYSQDVPILYGANKTYVDADLKNIGLQFDAPIVNEGLLERIVFYNIIGGCSMVFNPVMKVAIDKYYGLRRLATFRVHDTYIMFVSLLFGKFVYDHRPCMSYRRHDDNATTGGLKKGRFLNRVERFVKIIQGREISNHDVKKTAKILLEEGGGALTHEQQYHLMILSCYNESFIRKVKLMFSFNILKYSDDCILVSMLKVLFERY